MKKTILFIGVLVSTLCAFGQTATRNTVSTTGMQNYVATYVNTNYTKPTGGAANQVVGINAGNTAQEFKTLTAGTGVAITYPSPGVVTIAAPGFVSTTGTPVQYAVPRYTTAAGTPIEGSTVTINPNGTINAPGNVIATGNVTGTIITGNTYVINGGGSIIGATFVPTTSSLLNLNTATIPVSDVFKYSRVGNMITVSGQIAADPIAANTDSAFVLTIPVAMGTGGATGIANAMSTVVNIQGCAGFVTRNDANSVRVGFTSNNVNDVVVYVHYTYYIN